VEVDAGARHALLEGGKSLLAAGITKVEGTFSPGAVIEIFGPEQDRLATGLTEFSAEDLKLIQGQKSPRIFEILGPAVSTEVVHRDNLVLTPTEMT
jgi:glutamate 5-kinase